MRILYVADGRSPTALNWIRHFVQRGDKVHLVSTFPANNELNTTSFQVVPVAYASAAGQAGSAGGLRRLIPTRLRTRLRQSAGPRTLTKAAEQLNAIITDIKPDLVHALRIPYEGMLASLADPAMPLVVSIWGNDLTLHAPATRAMGQHTRRTLRRADALLADCQRDLRQAVEWGFSNDKLSAVFPGGGGIRKDVFHPPVNLQREQLVINPRGLRAYVRNDAFFQAIPLVLGEIPEARFVCPSMAGEAEAERWVAEMGITAQVELLPRQSEAQMAALYQRSQVAVSPSEHDGTPNTLLEAMACGCFPVAGDIESLREWITDGSNGLLVDPADPVALANAILRGLRENELQGKAAAQNARLIAARAEHGAVMAGVEQFYEKVIRE